MESNKYTSTSLVHSPQPVLTAVCLWIDIIYADYVSVQGMVNLHKLNGEHGVNSGCFFPAGSNSLSLLLCT